MKINDLLITSIKNLWRRKVRTILTVIGVLIGSTSIIIMLSMGFALTKNNDQMFEEIGGMSILTVYPADSWNMDSSQNASSENSVLNDISIKKLSKIEGVQSAIPFKSFTGDSPGVVKGKYISYAQILATDFKYLDELGYSLEQGTMPTGKYDLLAGSDIRTFQKYTNNNVSEIEVDLLNDKIELQYPINYGDENLSEKPKINKQMKFSGILNSTGDDVGYSVLISLDYFDEIAKEMNKYITDKDQKINTTNYSNIKIKINEDADMLEVENSIKEAGFVVYSNAEYYNEIKKSTDSTRNMFLIVGAVAFIVAVIGIANTMIMSVYERTKEIGVMKVIGASLKDIRNMFLMEATFIGLFGGIISIAFSYLVSYILNTFGTVQGNMGMFMGEEETTMLVSYIPIWLPFIGVLFSTLVGLLSGYLPSKRATKISAIEAIRDQ